MRQLQLTTEADKEFQQAILDGKTLEEASFLAFPSKEFPVKYAMAKIDNEKFVRANYHTLLAKAGLSEEESAIQLKKAFTLAEDDPKAATTILKLVQELHKVYNLYPEVTSTPSSLQVGTLNLQDNSVTNNTKQQVLQNMYEEALEEMPEEEIDSMVESAILDERDVIPKVNLFEKDNK
jgi:hypothetical protein